MPRVIVGNCSRCGRELRVKEGAVQPKMRLTCSCGQVNTIGQDLTNLGVAERAKWLLDTIASKNSQINSNVLSAEMQKLLKEENIPALAEFLPRICSLANNPEIDNRDILIKCLQHLGGQTASETLWSIAEFDKDTWIRSRAIHAIVALHESDAAAKFISLLHANPDSGLKWYIIPALGEIFYQEYIYPCSVLDTFKYGRNYTFADYKFDHSTIPVIFCGGDEEIIRFIGETAVNDPDNDIRLEALRTLKLLKHKIASSYLSDVFRNADDEARKIIAFEALNELKAANSEYSLDN
jgi:hypothetical protein